MSKTPTGKSDLGERAPVSVVIPCYRCSGTLDRALKSVAAQTWPPRETLLVDDGNDAETARILQAQPTHYPTLGIRVVVLPCNAGAASARNAGWQAATQPYLAFLDADDAWHAKKLELQVPYMQAHPDIGITGHRLGDQEKAGVDVDGPQVPVFCRVTRRRLLFSNPLSTPTVVLQRSLALRFRAEQRHSEDYALWLEASCRGVPIALSDSVLGYRFKAAYGASGLSAALWAMERAELGNYRSLRGQGLIGRLTLAALTVWSLAKFVRRVLIARCTRLLVPPVGRRP